MRLGQLSRKISVRSNDIVDFLSKRGVELEDSFNARVDDEHVQLVISQFAPHLMSEPVSAERDSLLEEAIEERVLSKQPQSDEPDLQPERPVSLPAAEPKPDLNERPEEVGDNVDGQIINEVNGVIKPSKVELQGLKVLGRIELPVPKKKEPESNPDGVERPEAPAEREESHKSKHAPRPRRSQDRPRKNPVVLDRERRAREQEEQRKQQDELEKQRKAQYYHKRVKPKGPTKAIRIHNEEVAPVEDIQPQPKTLWGKFVKWLTS